MNIFCIYVFQLLIYYKYNELGLVKKILCFHDALSSISVQGESNNGSDFVTAL